MRTRWVLVVAAVAAGGCSVPGRPRLAMDVRGVEKELDKAESAAANQDNYGALKHIDKVEDLASKLAKKLLIGNPLRERLDDAVGRARDLEAQISERLGMKGAGDDEAAATAKARQYLAEAGGADEKVKGPPEGADLSSIGDLPGGPEGTGPRAGLPDADADVGGFAGRLGDGREKTEGDVANEPELEKKEEVAAKTGRPEELQMTEDETRELIVQKVLHDKNGVVAYFTFFNRTEEYLWLASITGEFMSKGGAKHSNVLGGYKAEGFRPNWEAITDSSGQWVAVGEVGVHGRTPIQLVAIGEKKTGIPEKVKVEVRTMDNRVFRAVGP
jgi:hypothetical protein